MKKRVSPAVKNRKNPAAVALGRKGGEARWDRVPKRQRSEIMRQTVQARWDRQRKAK